MNLWRPFGGGGPAARLAAELRVRMVPDRCTIDGRTLHYAVSDNAGASGPAGEPPLWAVNVHGFFAGGGMYWRESARLAGGLGLRVVNPSLPAFGGSDPLPWDRLSMASFAEQIARLLDHLGLERVLLLGHSMGGAIAMRFAHDHPDRTLGVVYRDGAGPSSWKVRDGFLARALDPLSPDVGGLIELAIGAVADVPDLAWGRVGSMVRGVLPDARLNFQQLADTFPVAAMLFNDSVDHVIEAVGQRDIPVLPVWGRLDRLVPPTTGKEFGDLVGEKVLWVTGGHSWMLPRPGTQLHLLRRHRQGRGFLDAVEARAARPAIRSVG